MKKHYAQKNAQVVHVVCRGSSFIIECGLQQPGSNNSPAKKEKEEEEMLQINWDDVAKVVGTMIPHLVAIVIALVAAIVVTVVAIKAPKGTKGLIRGRARGSRRCR